MDKKVRDSVFGVCLILVGAYVLAESWRMLELASKPPFNIGQFRISPAMLPMILGAGLIFFSVLMLVDNLRGEGRPVAAFLGHMRAAAAGFRRALGDIDARSMAVSVLIMFLYTFFVLGTEIPFWAGAVLFLAALMLFLRAAKIWAILLASAVSVALIMLLFQGIFKTTLP